MPRSPDPERPLPVHRCLHLPTPLAAGAVCWLLVSFLVLLIGCEGGGGSNNAPPPFGLVEREVVTTLTFPTGLPDPTPLERVEAFPNLSFTALVSLVFLEDGSDRLCVVEKAGRIRIFPDDPDVLESTLFLDITDRVQPSFEEGLLGLAFDPGYSENGFFYVYYNAEEAPRRTILSRFRVSDDDPDAADPASEVILLEIDQPFQNHNGGGLVFGPDDELYLSLGDGGFFGDPLNNAQDPTTLLGSIIRIHPESDGTYSIPEDNPFFGARDGTREEIWAYGLRNPWRFSFDRANGDLWLADVGGFFREEINRVEPGDNLGWSVFEGSDPFMNPDDLPPTDFKAPLFEYGHDQGSAIIGGHVYRGTGLTGFSGAYFYGDFGSGRIWALVVDGVTGEVISNTEVATVLSLTTFAEDESGELLAGSIDGRIYRFELADPSDPPVEFPERLSETGLFADLVTLEPEPGVVEYGVNVPLWSDAALKRRWIALPGVARIMFDPQDPWTFPVGTVLVKHFELELSVGDPSSATRLETRVFLHTVEGWRGFTYRWLGDQSDALLLDGAEDETFVIEDPAAPGGEREQVWHFPSRIECDLCHTSAAGRVLGVRTTQLNRTFDYESAVDNQLRSWDHVDFFATGIGNPDQYADLASLDESSVDVETRVRGYLDANCSHCHRPEGPTPVVMDLRYQVPSDRMGVIGVPPVAGDLGLPDALIVSPGNKESSVLWERMRRLDEFRMPPLGSGLVDEAAVELVGEWIDSLP